jgi:S-formylglutathione hydrolase
MTPGMTVETLSEHACWGGVQGFYAHASAACAGRMKFGVFLPPQARERPVPALYYLAGLTCTEETFAIKAGAQRLAAELGVALVTPDTSPRETALPGDRDSWDFGQGAGFYLDATRAPWSSCYRMFSYVTEELPAVVEGRFAVRADRRGLFGHSMGGHGALVCALRRPDRYRTLSALAPIGAPSQVPWGEKAFTNYLGPDRAAWAAWDACALMRAKPFPGPVLVDQGLADQFLDKQLKPELLEAAAVASGQALTLRRHPGYDHVYFFIQTVVADHLRHHAAGLL